MKKSIIARISEGGGLLNLSGRVFQGFTLISRGDGFRILRDLTSGIYKAVIARPDFRKGAVARSAPARKLEPDVTPATTRIIR